MDRSRLRARVALGAALAVVLAGTLLVSPEAVLSRAAWLVADPVRLVAASVALAAVRPLVAWPTTVLAVLLGYGLGPAGFPLALALVALTSVPPFLLARRFGQVGELAESGAAFVDHTGGVRSVVASRLVPAPSDVVSVAAGIAGVRLSVFLVGTAIGEIPWVLAGVLAGASAESLAAGDLASAADLRLVAAAGLAAVLLLGPRAYEWYLDRDSGDDAGDPVDGDS
ncbi:TVP38/TMEM64 family protein [Halobellus litoreus]|uniref:TVP38/TMEM64 family protein n=1 Tax=Halobellus litoreus TaxID=755310 RepID=A0ABD6DU77_9EURY|nr:VTT domain-containing protein [Halobellus litoreus]